MQYLVSLLVALAVVPVLAFGFTISGSALYSLFCVGLIVVSLFVMFSPGETNRAA